MKKLLLFASFIFISLNSVSQDLTFADSDLESYLMSCSNCMRNLNDQIQYDIDVNGDGVIQQVEANNINQLEIDNVLINDLSGLEQFLNLSQLTLIDTSVSDLLSHSIPQSIDNIIIYDKAISHVQLENFADLKTLYIDCMGPDCSTISGIELRNLPSFESIGVRHDGLQHFVHSGLPFLKSVNFGSLMDTQLNLDGLPVEGIGVSNAPNISQIITGINPHLETLALDNVNISQLDLSGNHNIKNLSIKNILMNNLDISNLNLLEQLDLSNSTILQYNLGSLENLTRLFLHSNPVDLSIFNSSFDTLINLVLAQNNLQVFDISPFTNLRILSLSDNSLTQLTGSNDNITNLNITGNDFTQFDTSIVPNLESLGVYQNPLVTLDVSQSPSFRSLGCSNTLLRTLDFSNNSNFSVLRAHNVPIEWLNLKNGNANYCSSSNGISIVNHPDPTQFKYLCVDDEDVVSIDNCFNGAFPNLQVNSYCSFELGGNSHQLLGQLMVDMNGTGCGSSNLSLFNTLLEINDQTSSGLLTTNLNGQYFISLTDGQHTITPQPENPSYWNFSPASVTVDFPTQTSPFTQDFCVTPNGTIEDLEIIVTPIEQARPGFETDYKVLVKNKGNQNASGTVTLDYDADYMTLFDSAPAAGTAIAGQLDWSFTDIAPFQVEEYRFTMTLNTPTDSSFPLNGDDELSFLGTVTGTGTDNMPGDNTMTLEQIVVNSFDPNDKRCLEGEKIEPSMVGEYVHYMIRFENTGTASAINVVVKDAIDPTMFDVSTFVPLGGSHDYYVRTVEDGNTFEFIHENINLDFNDATNDGYVLFKIKTLPTLMEGDTFNNDAEIYFDFNAPIVTNDFTTTVQSTASVSNITDDSISISPNPTSGIIQLNAKNEIQSLTVHDLNGRLLNKTTFVSGALNETVNLENLNSGIYLMTVETSEGQTTKRVVVK